MSTPGASATTLTAEDIRVVLVGEVPPRMRDYAQERAAHVTRVSGRPITAATVTLRQRAGRATATPSRAEITFTVAGRPVRTQVDAATPGAAIDAAADTMERRIVDQVNRLNDRSRWVNAPGRKPRQQRPRPIPTPDSAAVATDERHIVRRKTFSIEPTTVDEAAYDMAALEHDFHLFADAATGRPALIWRHDNGGYAVAGLDPDALPEGVKSEPKPPVLDEAAAVERLDAGGEPFVFYLDAGTGQGNVVYRRDDGNYGLITPAA